MIEFQPVIRRSGVTASDSARKRSVHSPVWITISRIGFAPSRSAYADQAIQKSGSVESATTTGVAKERCLTRDERGAAGET
jgi:hypothetical protein